MAEQTKAKIQRTVRGVVCSAGADKTRVVKIVRKIKHPVVGKFISRTTKLAIHDESNDSSLGDTVLIKEGRPRSKTKSWELVEVLQRAEQV